MERNILIAFRLIYFLSGSNNVLHEFFSVLVEYVFYASGLFGWSSDKSKILTNPFLSNFLILYPLKKPMFGDVKWKHWTKIDELHNVFKRASIDV